MTNADWESRLRRLDRRVSGRVLLAAGLGVLLLLSAMEAALSARARAAAAARASVDAARADLKEELAARGSLAALVARDLARVQAGAARDSRSRRDLIEGGLALAEERRLLEKQWEILTTYIVVDPDSGRVDIMRGGQAFESRPLGGARPRAVGGEKRPMPRLATIVSKERYAHTERGQAREEGGRLEWRPPQVGTSARAGALGSYVLFTKEGLILHGPPLNKAEHEAYPHLCLSLPLATARRLFERSFIGTRVLIEGAP